jgi:phosphoribosyl 1,2-cyclic phosphodiesterase
MSGCGLVMLESNHDVGMLRNGSYPYYLKRRILSDTGHLSNDECSSVLPALAECGTKNFVLAHLSLENNLPQLAVEAAKCSLAQAGDLNAGCTVEAAPRSGPGRLYRVAPCGDMACSM